MTDHITRLASEYYDFRQGTAPTLAHLRGDYRFADRAEDVSRAAEDAEIAESRAFAARAEAIPEDALAGQDRLTREMVAWDARARADLVEARLAEIAVDSDWGPQVALPALLPQLGLPTADSPRRCRTSCAASAGCSAISANGTARERRTVACRPESWSSR